MDDTTAAPHSDDRRFDRTDRHDNAMRRPFILLTLLPLSLLSAQPRAELVLDRTYEELGIVPRIAHSGIYGVASFDLSGDSFFLRDFDRPAMSVVTPAGIERKALAADGTVDVTAPGTAGQTARLLRASKHRSVSGTLLYKKSFAGGRTVILADEGGTAIGAEGERVTLRLDGRRSLTVTTELGGTKREFLSRFPGDLAYAELIGIDALGNTVLLTERYRSEIPLRVQRYVHTYRPDGAALSVLEVPMVRYCSTVKEFVLDASGSLYHMMTTRDGVRILRWDGLAAASSDTVRYPAEYGVTEHFNAHLPVTEPREERAAQPLTAGDRRYALRLGEEYVRHTYVCLPANLSRTDVTAPDGDVVRTPGWLIAGTNARVAYKWGGFSTLMQYDDGLKAGKYSGDINTDGVSSYAVGVDCSGFVSRCWGLTYHSSTSNMPTITTQYASWDDLKPGDAVHKVGHVRLFVEKMPNGALRIVEASGRDWATTYWSYAPSDLQGVYTPRYYNGMVTAYSVQRPELLSAALSGDTAVTLTWRCDTANVAGYRLYGSVDGAAWTLLQSEPALKETTAVTPIAGGRRSYRVASVQRGTAAESDWSGVLSAAAVPHAQRALFVDGLEKTTGSWRGSGQTFAARYANVLAKRGTSFESVKNTRLADPRFSLAAYDAVYWMLGDESTESETFSAAEQGYVKQYLENGGALFVSGSEVGWDLSAKGSAADKAFYASYLKAAYLSDDAGVVTVTGAGVPPFASCAFTIGQMYDEDYPDEIDTTGGSTLIFRYGNSKGAGVQYSGTFGGSAKKGKVIYLAFPLESTASDTAFAAVMEGAAEFFDPLTSVTDGDAAAVNGFSLSQNHPNPFNPVTTIVYSLPQSGPVRLAVYDALGREVSVLLDGHERAGTHRAAFDASRFASGVYYCTLTSGAQRMTRKMMLLK